MPRAPTTTAVSSLFRGTARIQRPLDDYAIAPAAIQFPVTAVGSDFLETEPLQKGAARKVLRKHSAQELMHASGGRRLDQG